MSERERFEEWVRQVDPDNKTTRMLTSFEAWQARADIAAERERELSEALDAALSMLEDSLAGLTNPDTKVVYRKGVDDVALTPDGSMTLLRARAILEGKTNQ